jgi:hypothetical protein
MKILKQKTTFEKEVAAAVIRGHRHSTAIEDMTRISHELNDKVEKLLMERAYEMCEYEIGTILKHTGKGYTDYHFAYVRRLNPDQKNVFDLQIVPLTKRLKRHQKYGVMGNYIWHYSLHRWAVHRTGYTMERIGEKSVQHDETARRREAEARERKDG